MVFVKGPLWPYCLIMVIDVEPLITMVNGFDFDERRGRTRMNGSKGRKGGMKDIIPGEHGIRGSSKPHNVYNV